MPVSNGYRFSNYDGSPNIPRLCDPNTGDYEDMWRNTDSTFCDTCSYHGYDVEVVSFPAVLQERNKNPNYGYDEQEDRIVRARRAATMFYVRVCPECYALCEKIMKTSDHITLGADWWDMNDSLTENIKQLKREQFDWRQTKPIKDAVRAATQIFVAKTGPFNLLPQDVIISMYPLLVHAYKERAAIQIQSMWKGFYLRRYRNTAKDKYHNCEDCGRLRPKKELCTERSCLDCPYECCQKRVCKDQCHYLCPQCEGSNYVAFAWKNHEGERMFEECRWCSEKFELPIFWHGQNQTEVAEAITQN